MVSRKSLFYMILQQINIKISIDILYCVLNKVHVVSTLHFFVKLLHRLHNCLLGSAVHTIVRKFSFFFCSPKKWVGLQRCTAQKQGEYIKEQLVLFYTIKIHFLNLLVFNRRSSSLHFDVQEFCFRIPLDFFPKNNL